MPEITYNIDKSGDISEKHIHHQNASYERQITSLRDLVVEFIEHNTGKPDSYHVGSDFSDLLISLADDITTALDVYSPLDDDEEEC